MELVPHWRVVAIYLILYEPKLYLQRTRKPVMLGCFILAILDVNVVSGWFSKRKESKNHVQLFFSLVKVSGRRNSARA